MQLTGAAMAAAAIVLRPPRACVNVEPARPGEVYEVEKAGTGLCLFDLHQLSSVTLPLFRTVLSDDGTQRDTGEDIYACHRLRAAGLRIVVDYTFPTTHLAQLELSTRKAFD